MFKKLITLTLTALASLTIASFGAPAIPITYAPYYISAPGKYILANDITWTGLGGAAIVIGGINSPPTAKNITLDLNGHTVTALQGTGIQIGNSYTNVSNGKIVSPTNYGLWITGSYNVVSNLTITVGPVPGVAPGEGPGVGIVLEGFPYSPGQYSIAQFNQISDCTIIGVAPTAVIPQQADAAIQVDLASNNIIENCTLEGSFFTTISEWDQDSFYSSLGTVLGNNTYSGIHFANPTYLFTRANPLP